MNDTEHGRLLDADTATEVLGYIKEMWQYDVVLEEVDENDNRLKIHRT